MEKKVLVVDDWSGIRKMVEFTLKARGFQASLAKDGIEALELMANEQFDAIILDINMPRMNGLEFLRKIRTDDAYPSIPVIMLTIEAEDEDKDKAVTLGATAYLAKPFKPTQLLALLEKILS